MAYPGLVNISGLEMGFFHDFAIPESVTSGGKYGHKVWKQPGGARQIDMMGDDPSPVKFGGLFLEADAVDKMNHLNALKKAGNPVFLNYGGTGREQQVLVVITDLTFLFLNNSEIEYRIELTPILNADNVAQPAAGGGGAPPIPPAGGLT